MSESEFYESHYGNLGDSGRARAVARVLKSFWCAVKGENIRLLDIGCGSMAFYEGFIGEIEKDIPPGKRVVEQGWDVSHTAIGRARQRGYSVNVRDISLGDIAEDENGRFDVILFLEVIEHLVDTDKAIKNIHSLLAPNGLLVLTTPNLASWYNRLLLLMGYQPHGTEVSSAPCRFGCGIVGRLLGEKPGANVVAGHLRVFTLRALREFLEYHGFEIQKVAGISNHSRDYFGRLLSSLWLGGVGDVLVLARKKS